MDFESFNFNPRLKAGVAALGYMEPTPIQEQAMPPVLAGRDVLGLAQTGTGKTAAFALPILERLGGRGAAGRVRALIVAPTRELAEQTHVAFGDLGQFTRVRSLTLYGGVGMNPQVQRLRQGVEVVVACPGRLLDHINRGTIDLRHVEVLVLDEADRMFDMGFLPDIRKILKHLPAARQTLLFSATMPDDIRHLAHEVLHNPVTVQVGDLQPVATVSHALYPVESHLKTELLIQLLYHTDTESVLVFTRTKHRAERLSKQLKAAGFSVASLQGNLSQSRRQTSLDGFRTGQYQILVATDIAARGIDVSRISHVINYDMPDTADAYTHRIGRTGRAAKTGDAFTLVTGEDADMVRAIERSLGAKVERRLLPDFNYAAGAPPKEPARKPAPQARAARPEAAPAKPRPVRRPETPKASVKPAAASLPRAPQAAHKPAWPGAAGKPRRPARKPFRSLPAR
jgi:ATP-dependent RNA helicase RhlE